MKIVLVGGGGFIGSFVADRLLDDGHFVRILERPGVSPWRRFAATESLEWQCGDLRREDDALRAVTGMDTVVHLASTTVPASSQDDPEHDVQSNLVPALGLLRAMVDRSVGHIVFLSSGGTVYGPADYIPIDEAHPTRPIVAYGATKLAIEQACRVASHQYGLRADILRVSNAFGPRQPPGRGQGAVATFIDHALSGTAIEIWGDGGCVRDYVHVDDVARAVSRTLDRRSRHHMFNIGSGRGTRLLELISLIERQLGRSLSVIHRPARSFDVGENVLDISRAAGALDWRPEISLAEGIATTFEWYAEQWRSSNCDKRLSNSV